MVMNRLPWIMTILLNIPNIHAVTQREKWVARLFNHIRNGETKNVEVTLRECNDDCKNQKWINDIVDSIFNIIDTIIIS